jgi:integral membrane protein
VTAEPTEVRPAARAGAPAEALSGGPAGTRSPSRPVPPWGSPGGRFRIVAVAEAVSWAGLLVGMFFKYVVVGNEIGVRVFGPIHGTLFLAYLGLAVAAARAHGWGPRTTLTGLAASVPPFGSVVFERWVTRKGQLPTGTR